MVTADEVAAIAIFAGSRPSERERLARAAADISLVAGRVRGRAEGSERALFGLLEGRIEAVKVVDGIERVVGERAPGDIFGEVPITLGTVFPVGFPRRRGIARDAARAARLPRRRGRGARTSPRRSAGSRATASRARAGCRASRPTPPPPRAVVVGHRWDASCAEVRRFLDRNQHHVRLDHAGRPGCGRAVGRAAAGR